MKNLHAHETFFAEIAEYFRRKGFIFQFTLHGLGGQTTPTSSGGFIEISHYLGDDCMVNLQRTDPHGPGSYRHQACIKIHQRLVMGLIYNKLSPDGWNFHRQNMPAIQKTGVEKFVASLIRLHLQYDWIWFSLESLQAQENLAQVSKNYTDAHKQIMESVVDVTLSNALSVH